MRPLRSRAMHDVVFSVPFLGRLVHLVESLFGGGVHLDDFEHARQSREVSK